MKFRKCLPIRGHTVGLVIAFEDAAKWMEQGGREIGDISSIGGRTIEEAYYHKLEYVYRGYALIVLAVGA